LFSVFNWKIRRGCFGIVVAGCLGLGATAAQCFAQSESKQNYRLSFDAPAELITSIRAETLLGRWQERTEFSVDQLDALVFRAKDEIAAVLRGQGYFDFEIIVQREPLSDQTAKPLVKIEISAGARTTINDLNFSIQGDARENTVLMNQIQAGWSLPEGGFYRAALWEQSKKTVLDSLQGQGYLSAKVVMSQVSVDVRNTTAGVEVVFESGPRYKFGEIKLEGLKRYEPSIVDALRSFKPGDFYRLDSLIEFQTRLRDSGYFSSVTVAPQISDILNNDDSAAQTKSSTESERAPVPVPVLVDLKERESKRFLFGLGYSTDQGPRAQVGFENRNLLGKGLQLESGILIERIRQRIFTTVRTPLDETGHYYSLGGRFEKFNLSGEEAFKNTVFAQRGRRSAQIDSVISVQYQTERLLIDRGAGVQVGDSRAALTLGYSWNLRRIDSRIDPREGYTISSQVTLAAKGLASDQSFVRFYTRAMNFLPLTNSFWPKGATLISLAEVGVVAAESRQGIPSDNLFRTGGAQSIRGYRYLGLGAMDGTAIIGGRYLALASLEYQQPVYKNILAAVFVDAGDAGDSRSTLKAKIGTGVGMRWRSPIGPVNIDAAYGAADKRWRLHFSVGYSF
jgi:translocation and assembly module TamA